MEASNNTTADAEKHLKELLLRHRGLFEALLNVEGIDDESSIGSQSYSSTLPLSAPTFDNGSNVVHSLKFDEPLICKETTIPTGSGAFDYEQVSIASAEDLKSIPGIETSSWRQRVYMLIIQNYAEIMDALAVTNEDLQKIAKPPKPLNVTELRHNIKRCIKQTKPYIDVGAGFYDIITWKSPLFSLFMFWVYLSTIFSGYFVTLSLGLLLTQMFINYLAYCQNISLGIKFIPHRNTQQVKFDFSGAQMIIEISRLMQMYLDYAADVLEKIRNLLCWKVPQTSCYFSALVLYWFILSIVLSVSWFITIIAFGIGFKLFVTTYLFHRFPMLIHKLDVIVWFLDRLPAERPLSLSLSGKVQENLNKNSRNSRFYLTDEENEKSSGSPSQKTTEPEAIDANNDTILARKCALFDSEKSFPLNVGSGKLKISESSLAFKYSRFNAGVRDDVCIDFQEILSVKKTKTFRWTNWRDGSSIEIYVAGKQKPYVFAGIFGRDAFFDQLIALGKKSGVPWTI